MHTYSCVCIFRTSRCYYIYNTFNVYTSLERSQFNTLTYYTLTSFSMEQKVVAQTEELRWQNRNIEIEKVRLREQTAICNQRTAELERLTDTVARLQQQHEDKESQLEESQNHTINLKRQLQQTEKDLTDTVGFV